MRTIRYISPILAVLLAISCLVAGAECLGLGLPAEIPAFIDSTTLGEGPAWVSATTVVVADGTFDLEPFTGTSHDVVAARLRAIERALARQREQDDRKNGLGPKGSPGSIDCPALSIVVAHPPKDAGTFLRAAHSIVVGEVESVDVGFSLGTDSTLVKLHLTHRLRAGSGLEKSDSVLLVLPYARFVAAGLPFCRGVDLPSGYQVSPGDILLVVLDQPAIGSGSSLFQVAAHGVLFFAAASGELVVSPAFHDLFGDPPVGIAEQLVRWRDTDSKGSSADPDAITEWFRRIADSAGRGSGDER